MNPLHNRRTKPEVRLRIAIHGGITFWSGNR
jgi:hypothetical protein